MDALWLDWCEVTSTDPEQRDADVIARFTTQARPSRATIAALTGPASTTDAARATAWPHQRAQAGLEDLLQRTDQTFRRADRAWSLRLKLLRLQFAAVLIAPRDQGGLALGREALARLTPRELHELRPAITTTAAPAACPACTASWWLEVLATANTWSRAAVTNVLHQRVLAPADDDSAHRHDRRDPSDAWRDWPDLPNLLPAIDRWNYVSLRTSMHRSSLSVLIANIAEQLHEPFVPPPTRTTTTLSAPPRAITRIDPRDDADLLARADEVADRADALNRRLLVLLEQADSL